MTAGMPPQGQMASLFSRGGAAYSPQATPPTEMNSFIRQHNAQVIGGQQIIPRTGSQARNVAKAYDIDPATGMYVFNPEAIKLGKKTGPYADAKDPTIPSTDLYKTASDIWHGRVMGYSDPGGKTFSRGFTPQEHGFLTGENLLLANRAEQKDLLGSWMFQTHQQNLFLIQELHKQPHGVLNEKFHTKPLEMLKSIDLQKLLKNMKNNCQDGKKLEKAKSQKNHL